VNINMLIILIVGSIMSLAWLFLLLVGNKKYGEYFSDIPLKSYPVKPIFPIGLYAIELAKYDFSSKHDRLRLQQCRNIYGKENYEFYFYLNNAMKISIPFTVLIISLFIYPLSNDSLMTTIGLCVTVFSFVFIDDAIKDRFDKREDELMRDFPGALSKIALLVNAGINTIDAWKITANSGRGVLFEEMKKTSIRVENGMSFTESLVEFGNDCGDQKIKKISSILAQNIQKGNDDINEYLQTYSREMWEEKKHRVRRKGEQASSKLLIPIGMMFLGILALIGIPLIANLNV